MSKFLALLGTLIAATAAITSAASLNPNARIVDNTLYSRYLCQKKPNGFKAIVPGSCSRYYQCYSGQSVEIACPHFFDAKRQACVDYNTGCVEDLEVRAEHTAASNVAAYAPCAGKPNGYVVGENQAYWYECRNCQVVASGVCPIGQEYNLALLRCDVKSECGAANQPPCGGLTTPCVTPTTTCTTTKCSTTTCAPTEPTTVPPPVTQPITGPVTDPVTEATPTTCTTTACTTTKCSTTTCTPTEPTTVAPPVTQPITGPVTVPVTEATPTTCKTTACTTTKCSTTTCAPTEPTTVAPPVTQPITGPVTVPVTEATPTTCTTTACTTTKCAPPTTPPCTTTTKCTAPSTETTTTTSAPPTTTARTRPTRNPPTPTKATPTAETPDKPVTAALPTRTPATQAPTTSGQPEQPTTTCDPPTTKAPCTTKPPCTTQPPCTTTSACTTTTCAPPKLTPATPYNYNSNYNNNNKNDNNAQPNAYVRPAPQAGSIAGAILLPQTHEPNIDMYVRYACRQKANGFMLASLRSCNEYYICRNGDALRVSCGDMYFNSVKGQCDLPQNTGCIQPYPLLK